MRPLFHSIIFTFIFSWLYLFIWYFLSHYFWYLISLLRYFSLFLALYTYSLYFALIHYMYTFDYYLFLRFLLPHYCLSHFHYLHFLLLPPHFRVISYLLFIAIWYIASLFTDSFHLIRHYWFHFMPYLPLFHFDTFHFLFSYRGWLLSLISASFNRLQRHAISFSLFIYIFIFFDISFSADIDLIFTLFSLRFRLFQRLLLFIAIWFHIYLSLFDFIYAICVTLIVIADYWYCHRFRQLLSAIDIWLIAYYFASHIIFILPLFSRYFMPLFESFHIAIY